MRPTCPCSAQLDVRCCSVLAFKRCCPIRTEMIMFSSASSVATSNLSRHRCSRHDATGRGACRGLVTGRLSCGQWNSMQNMSCLSDAHITDCWSSFKLYACAVVAIFLNDQCIVDITNSDFVAATEWTGRAGASWTVSLDECWERKRGSEQEERELHHGRTECLESRLMRTRTKDARSKFENLRSTGLCILCCRSPGKISTRYHKPAVVPVSFCYEAQSASPTNSEGTQYTGAAKSRRNVTRQGNFYFSVRWESSSGIFALDIFRGDGCERCSQVLNLKGGTLWAACKGCHSTNCQRFLPDLGLEQCA